MELHRAEGEESFADELFPDLHSSQKHVDEVCTLALIECEITEQWRHLVLR